MILPLVVLLVVSCFSTYHLYSVHYNSEGFPTSLVADFLSLSPGHDPTSRSYAKMKEIGLQGKDYDVGHVVGNRFGGPADYLDGQARYWIPQKSEINRGAYRLWEDMIATNLTDSAYAHCTWTFSYSEPIKPSHYTMKWAIYKSGHVVYSGETSFPN